VRCVIDEYIDSTAIKVLRHALLEVLHVGCQRCIYHTDTTLSLETSFLCPERVRTAMQLQVDYRAKTYTHARQFGCLPLMTRQKQKLPFI
jgi:hypothetical protein